MSQHPFLQPSNKDISTYHKVDLHYTQDFMHIHNAYEIYFSCCTGNKFFVGNKIHEVEKYDLFLFNNSDLHKISIGTQDPYDRYIIIFKPELFDKYLAGERSLLQCFDKREPQHTHKISFSKDEAAELLRLMHKMLDIEKANAYAKALKLELALAEILVFINEKREIRLSSSIVTKSAKTNDIMYYISQNFSSPLSLDVLATNFYINKFHLCRQFKNENGFGINDYIQSCRLSHAITLLQRGVPVSEAACMSGFSSDTYFISLFKKAIGISPKKYYLQTKRNT